MDMNGREKTVFRTIIGNMVLIKPPVNQHFWRGWFGMMSYPVFYTKQIIFFIAVGTFYTNSQVHEFGIL